MNKGEKERLKKVPLDIDPTDVLGLAGSQASDYDPDEILEAYIWTHHGKVDMLLDHPAPNAKITVAWLEEYFKYADVHRTAMLLEKMREYGIEKESYTRPTQD